MNEVNRVMMEVHEKLAKHRLKGYDTPSHLVLDIGAKQALKMTCHPFTDHPLPDVKTYLGMSVIDLEKIIIVDSQSLQGSVKTC